MNNKSKLKHYWHQVWHFIWHDNSIWSWVVNLILAFILIKFIIYPLLGMMLGTDFPIVAVVSGSMEHKITKDDFGQLKLCDKSYSKIFSIDFNEWWNACGPWYIKNTNVTKEDFSRFSFRNGFNTGDIIVLYSPKNIEVGEVIVFRSYNVNDPIIHRVVAIENGNVFITKGDHNPDKDRFISPTIKEEIKIDENKVLGKALFRIPLLGWIKILFVELLKFIGLL